MTAPTPDPQPLQALEDRIAALEAHIAHQESAQQDMSDMIARQWDEIDRLTRTLKLLHDQVRESVPTPEAQKPPHY